MRKISGFGAVIWVGLLSLLLINAQNAACQTEEVKREPLVEAMSEGDTDTFNKMLAAGLSPDGANGKSIPLIMAVADFPAFIAPLLTHKATIPTGLLDVGDKFLDENTIVHLMAEDDAGFVQLWLKAGGDVNAIGKGVSMLQHALDEEHIKVATLLVKSGADLNRRISYVHQSYSALAMATMLDSSLAQLMIERGADINQPAITDIADGENALSLINLAILVGDAKLTQWLTDHQAKPELDAYSGESGNTLLHSLARGDGKFANPAWSIQYLIKKGAKVNAINNEGKSPLHLAAESGRADMIALLLQHGAKKNWPDKQGNSPLHQAALAAQPEAVSALLLADADVNLKNSAGFTPLDVAVMTHWNPDGLHGADLIARKGGLNTSDKTAIKEVLKVAGTTNPDWAQKMIKDQTAKPE